jgi:DNA-binding SARP family transcriptional activator
MPRGASTPEAAAPPPHRVVPGEDADRSRVTVRLLGGFELCCDGAHVSLQPASQRLIAFLALHDRPLLRLYVAGSLWLDVEEARSCANLRSTLWRLRQPGHPIVEATATHIRLASTVVVDVRELVRVARQVLESPGAALDEAFDDETLEEDLLPDWYEEWVDLERERLRQLRLHAVEAAAEYALAQHRPARAVDLALSALRRDPLRESLHELVIRTHLARGNRAEAIRHHRGHVARMETELGLRPSPEITRLLRESNALPAGLEESS